MWTPEPLDPCAISGSGSVFGINMVAIVNGQPKLLNLKQILEAFLAHRREVVTRRTLFNLNRSINRAHILEGQTIALTNIDKMIALIKASKTPAEAQKKIISKLWKPGKVIAMLKKADNVSTRPQAFDQNIKFGIHKKGYKLSIEQAKAILELKLHRLTGLEQDRIFTEYSSLLDDIKGFTNVLENADTLTQVIKDELLETKSKYGDERKTEIVSFYSDFTDEDLIPREDLIVTLSREGYAKTQPLDVYRSQRRGGTGKKATSFKEKTSFLNYLLPTPMTPCCVFQVMEKSIGSKFTVCLELVEMPRAGQSLTCCH